MSIRTSGSGGYGDPLTREPARVARDVALGHVTPARARDWYGVVADATGVVDVAATDALRQSRRAAAGHDASEPTRLGEDTR